MSEVQKQSLEKTRREKITERYKGVDPSKLEVIPAVMSEAVNIMEQKLKVAAYVRVSTENDEQKSSFELQSNDFTNRINANPNWELVGIYADEGISGTELSHRKGMLQLIEDCKAGKINLILAKSIARFARNVVDCLSIIEELRNLNPPVGVYFDESNLYTLDTTGALVLTILATVAEEESRSKSFIMNWSVEKRFSNGIFLTPVPIGFDKDQDGNLIVNNDEAETVKVIYDLFINGWNQGEIADLLMEYNRRTKRNGTEWYWTSVDQILANERNCGDVLARKTYTPNFKDHKRRKNVNQRNKYRQRDHHDGIIDHDLFNAVQLKRVYMSGARDNQALPVLSVIDDGILKGYVPIHKDWTGFSGDAILRASQSVMTEDEKAFSVTSNVTLISAEKLLNIESFRPISGASFVDRNKPVLKIRNGRLCFSTSCLRLFQDIEYVEILVNPIAKCIAIRPSDKSNTNAIHWGTLREGKWAVGSTRCPGLLSILGAMMNCEEGDAYRFIGECFDNEKLLLFNMGDSVIERTAVPEKADEKSVDHIDAQTETAEENKSPTMVTVYPPTIGAIFDLSINSIATVSLLEQRHYAGDWDVLRPARELKEMSILTRERLTELMTEAETIIERWGKNNDAE